MMRRQHVVLHPDDHPERADLGLATVFPTAEEALAVAAPSERVWRRSVTQWREIAR